MTPAWPDDYPSRDVLKREVRALTEAFTEILLDMIGGDAIEGIYFKGSAQKQWESPVDYVPELSDVDIHLLFADDEDVKKHLGTAEQAVRIQTEVERRYFAALESPVHTARPQLIILNDLLKWDDYVHPPREITTTLYGRDLPDGDFDDTARLREIAHRQLMELAEYVAAFPLHVIDKPGKFLWQALRQMTWRVSPLAPKVLILKGVAPKDAWRMNRTALVVRLGEVGEVALADDYAGFYLNGWTYFLSGYADHDAARVSLVAGMRAITRALAIAP